MRSEIATLVNWRVFLQLLNYQKWLPYRRVIGDFDVISQIQIVRMFSVTDLDFTYHTTSEVGFIFQNI